MKTSLIPGLGYVTEAQYQTALLPGAGYVLDDTVTSGTLAATEAGADIANIGGELRVQGYLAALEAGADTAALSGQVLVQGTLAATESGGDIANIGGEARVQGYLAALESGQDSCAIAGTTGAAPAPPATHTGGGHHRRPWSNLNVYGPDPGPLLQPWEKPTLPARVARLAAREREAPDQCTIRAAVAVAGVLGGVEAGVDTCNVRVRIRASRAERARAALALLMDTDLAA